MWSQIFIRLMAELFVSNYLFRSMQNWFTFGIGFMAHIRCEPAKSITKSITNNLKALSGALYKEQEIICKVNKVKYTWCFISLMVYPLPRWSIICFDRYRIVSHSKLEIGEMSSSFGLPYRRCFSQKKSSLLAIKFHILLILHPIV